MQLHINTSGTVAVGSIVLSIRCPACKQIGTFNSFGQDWQFSDGTALTTVGHRMCPNPPCRAHLFVVLRGNELIISYPPERIDFDSTGVPAPVVESLEEAITCHANQCFVAAAIMVRKTLELLCVAAKASGDNLKEKINSLGSKVVLPPDLLNGLSDIRLLGNDAAHIESQAFSEVGQEEVEVATELTKEVLKAIYQYSGLLGRMKKLKKPVPKEEGAKQ